MSESNRNTEIFASLIARAKADGRADQLRDVIEALSTEADPKTLLAIRDMLDLLQTDAARMAPAEFVERALVRIRELEAAHSQNGIDAFKQGSRALFDRASSVHQKVREIVATLVLDSYEGAALPGIRGAARLQPRQLMYESPQGTVHLQVENDGAQVGILGQFLPAEGTLAGTTVQLKAGQMASTIELGETGEFAFSSLPSDRVEIRIRTRDHLLTLAPIDPILG